MAVTGGSKRASSRPTPLLLCPNCGDYCPMAATGAAANDNGRKIAELEAQVQVLRRKVVDADSKLADYEDSAHRLQPDRRPSTPANNGGGMFAGFWGRKASATSPPTSITNANTTAAGTPSRPVTPTPRPSVSDASRNGSSANDPVTSFPAPVDVSPSSNASSRPGSTSSAKEDELVAQLAREQDLRAQAEGKVSQLSSEMEDLSAQLFQQANEMVAAERRARARLEERVEMLERRDVEKRKRLERLEGALRRIDRVKSLLGT